LIDKKKALLNVKGSSGKVNTETNPDAPRTFATAEEYNAHVAQQMSKGKRLGKVSTFK